MSRLLPVGRIFEGLLPAFRRLARPKVWSAAVATVRVSQSLLGFQPEALLAHPDLTSGHVDQLDQRGPYRLQ